MLRRALVVVGLLLAVLVVPGSSNAALNICAERIAPEPERIGGSVLGADTDDWRPEGRNPSDALTSPDREIEVDPRGVYGTYGMAGQFWNKIHSSDCFDSTRFSITHDLATLTWGGVRTINTWTLRVFGWATGDDVNELFTPLVVDVITALRTTLWQPLIPAVVVLGSLWMMWQGLAKQRFTISVQGAVWMVTALVLGFWILFAPASALQTAMLIPDTGAAMANRAVSEVRVDGVALDCPGGSTRAVSAIEGESAAQLYSRETREMLWVALQCRGWQAGAFGTSGPAQEAAELYGYELLQTQSIGVHASQEQVDREKARYEELADTIEQEHPEAWLMFRGSLPEERLSIAGAAFAGSVLGGIPVLIASAALAVFKAAFLIGALFSPLFLLLGIHPGVGRRVLGLYGQVLGWLLVAQVAILLILAVMLLCYSLVFSREMSFGEQLICLFVLFLGGLAFWVPLWKLVRSAAGARDEAAVQAPRPLAAVTQRSAETWQWRTRQWGQRQAARLTQRVTGKADGGAPGAGAAPVAATGADAEAEQRRVAAPALGEEHQERVQRLARGQGVQRPAPRDRQESAGYRGGGERAPADAPSAPVAERPGAEQQQEVEVLRAVRTAEVGPSEPRRDPDQAPPVKPAGANAAPGRGAAPTSAPEPVRPPTRVRGGRDDA